jgi:hypothetical protein
MAKGFDHVMVHHNAGRNLKVRSFTTAEACAWVFGVLPIGGMARMRGAFMVGARPATARDVAEQSGQSMRTCTNLLQKMRDMGMLEHDPEIGAEWIHDFEEHNPEPKKDPTAAKRARDYRARQKQRHGVTNASRRDGHEHHGAITPPEVEGEEEVEDVVVEEHAPATELAAGVDAGVHPKSLPEVVAIFAEVKAQHPALQIEEAALSSAIRSKAGDPDCDPVAAAHAAAAMVHAGDARRLVASVLLLAAMDRQQANALRARQSGRPAPGSSGGKPAPVVDFSKYDKRAANG